MAVNKDHQHDVPERPDLSKPENRFEKSDVDYPAITKFGIALVILCIGSFLGLAWLYQFLIKRTAEIQPPARPGLETGARRLPPEPRLQATPIPDLKAVIDGENQILSSYAWIDKEKGVVRIPIARAIDVLATRGLPARAATPAPRSVTVPTESGLGPIMQQPGGPLAAAAPERPEK